MGIETAILASAGANLIGSKMAGDAAKSAARTSASSAERTGAMSASAGAFRPVAIRGSRFGDASFTMGTDKYGTPIVTGAEFQASPEITALQDRIRALYGDSLGQAEAAPGQIQPLTRGATGLFKLAEDYLATSPQAARQQYIAEQTALIDPLRKAEEQRLASTVFGRGRAGLSVGAQGQPELATLAAARRTQDLQLAAAAEQAAQQRIGFGADIYGRGTNLLDVGYGLQSKAFTPFLTQFGAEQALETAALKPFEMGVNLGGRNVNTAGASALLQSGLTAAQTQLQGSLVGPSLMASNLGNISNQYMRQQQQNQMFDRLYGMNSPFGQTDAGAAFRGVNLYGAGSSPVGNWYSQTPDNFIMP